MTEDLVKRLREQQFWGSISAGEAADRIEELEAALNKILQKCPYSKRDKWCSNLDCNCVVARAALGETK